MGMTVTAYSRMRFVHKEKNCKIKAHKHVKQAQLDFYSGLPCAPQLNLLDGRPEGCYVLTPQGKSHAFSGSWSGHLNHRDLLCDIALGIQPNTVWENPVNFAGRPFVELIDQRNSLIIGPETCKKLLHDFDLLAPDAENQFHRALAKLNLSPRKQLMVYAWLQWFGNWHEAVKIASNEGFIFIS